MRVSAIFHAKSFKKLFKYGYFVTLHIHTFCFFSYKGTLITLFYRFRGYTLLYIHARERSEFGRFWRPGEGNDVADVLHASDEEDEPLETKAEAGVRTGSITTGVEIPP